MSELLKLEQQHYAELVRLATNKPTGHGWIPTAPLQAARSRKLHTYIRANRVADLEKMGLVVIAPKAKPETSVIELTEPGKAAIRAMPDDIGAEWYPLPVDIAWAKELVG